MSCVGTVIPVTYEMALLYLLWSNDNTSHPSSIQVKHWVPSCSKLKGKFMSNCSGTHPTSRHWYSAMSTPWAVACRSRRSVVRGWRGFTFALPTDFLDKPFIWWICLVNLSLNSPSLMNFCSCFIEFPSFPGVWLVDQFPYICIQTVDQIDLKLDRRAHHETPQAWSIFATLYPSRLWLLSYRTISGYLQKNTDWIDDKLCGCTQNETRRPWLTFGHTPPNSSYTLASDSVIGQAISAHVQTDRLSGWPQIWWMNSLRHS